MHIYAFGSVCRGDVSRTSDIDLLAIVDQYDERLNPNDYSIYSYRRIREIWREGDPFAWHLASESKLLFTSDQSDFSKSLAAPAPYQRVVQDCQKFLALFMEARQSAETTTTTTTFDLSMIFLAIRNFATCFSLGLLDQADFSRRSAIKIGNHSLSIPQTAFEILERSRILCTRAIGPQINKSEADAAMKELPRIQAWMERLLEEVKSHDQRI
ncbi:nucleotidyltransferase domain-containing protein [Bradyrhizobium retamae]|uniref:Nucleotidyltransferase n=1 Tax=Bradyrhizobium retamae TaxID=1300035 RepID=A0A0R3MIN4_9BRAD|nr:nucleotidyltransferase domain-containing protein [Bradyrhizobium retamae]KRR17967.1 nucleotidyltransferase [Bradyrhizobium retamae]